ncbi:MAG: DUF6164 family protein [Gammaproteobacteria bacterium]|nr:DUF6164 family protein [Gammaproteobacteria bacterium]MDH5630042.1 DUF6164 family protein [Gammaproteobacteria bacterium]
MPSLLFKLNNVPDDEADDIRQMLSDADIEFYETDSGPFGLSFAGIWIVDDHELAQAQTLLDEYQQNRARLAREDYQTRKENGEIRSWWQQVLDSPVRSIAALFFILLILYLTLSPFLSLGK